MMRQKEKNQANIMTRNKHQKNLWSRRQWKNHDKEIILDRGCIWAINQTRLKRNENNAIATKPTWGCNAIFDYTYRCKIKKIPQNIYIYNIAIGIANSVAMTAILVLTSFSGRNKARGKGTKLAETGRYLVRHGSLPILSPLRRAKIAMPAKRGWWEPLAGALRML